jgi:hypothetical protein
MSSTSPVASSPPRVHHFVPQFWIKRFVSIDGKVWCFDRDRCQIEERSTKQLMQLFNLYTLQPSGIDDTSLESIDFNKIDSDGAVAFDTVLSGDYSQGTKQKLSAFLAAQVMRDPKTVGSYASKAQDVALALLDAYDAPDYEFFRAGFAARYPGPEVVDEAGFNYLKSLNLKDAENEIEKIVTALDAKGGLPELPFTDLIRNPNGRDIVRSRLLSFEWRLKINSPVPFVLGDIGVLTERGEFRGVRAPLSNSAALYLTSSDRPSVDIIVSTATPQDAESLNWESAARARRWLVGDKNLLEKLKDQVGPGSSALV